MLAELRLLILLIARQIEQMIQDIISRYLVKYHITQGLELPLWKLLSWDFIRNMTLKQILSILGIASFTVITFPLGVWLASFSSAMYIPIFGMFTAAINMLLIPVHLWGMNKAVKEISFSSTFMLGLLIIEIASVGMIAGWWFIWRAQQTA
jgi:hypothetical protein